MAMEVMVAVKSGTLLRALRVQLKRRVSARRGGDYSEVPQAIQKKSRPSPSNCVTPSAWTLRSEQGFGYIFVVKRRTRTRTRTNTNPNDTEANAAGRSVRACVAVKSKS